MIQQEKVKKSPAPIETIPEAPAKRARTVSWLTGGLVGMTVAFLALAGWTVYQRLAMTDAEHLARNAVAAWDSAKAAELTGVYDPEAVVVGAEGTRIVGLDGIVAAVRDRGPVFAVTQFGDIAVTRDGVYATTSYRYAGDGQGVGISVIEIADGTIVHQWNFEPSSASAPPAK